MQKIAIELDVLSRELPLGRLSFDEKVEIRKVREIAQMAQATGTGALVSSPCRRGIPAPTKSKPEDTFLFSLIFEKDPVFKISCLNRTLFFKKAGSVDQLIGLVKPMAEYLQTVGLNVSPNSAGEIQKKLLRIGVKRLTKWGGMSEGHDGAPHEGSFMLTRLVDFVSREQLPHPVFDHLPPGRTPGGRISSSPSTRVQRVGEGARRAGPPEVRHRGAGGPPPPPCEMGEGERSVEDRIADLLENLHGSNYYRRFLNKKKPDLPVWDRFYSLPLLDRDTFYRNSPPVSNDIFTRPSTDAYVYASGGTSGKAKYVLYGNDEYIKATDILSFIYETAGITKDDIVGNIFLAGNLWTSFNVACRALENLGCLNLPIGGATDFSNIIQYLQDFHATAIVGLPSIIVKLAEEVKARGISLRIPKILYGGEHMRPQTREFLKSALGCKWVRSAGYACVDTGPIGFQCEHLEGTLHHVLDKYQFVEIIKPEKGSSQAVYGKKEFSGAGEIVCTNLDRMLMPVVRYRTGDMGTWVKKINCPCGYKGRTFELLGRCDDLMVIGGINLMPSDISAGLAFLPVSPNFQVIARIRGKKDCLLLRLEAGKPLERKKVLEALEKGCYKLLETLKDGWLELELEWFPPGGLPRNQRTGKLKVMIDERG